MLFLLTGNIQTGKTRWLMRTLSALEESGVALYGALTPGVWRHRSPQEIEQEGGPSACGEYEKLGIDAVLLPQRERFFFARPVDREDGEAECDGNVAVDGQPANQSRRANLSWDISEEALAAINAHFDALQASGPSYSGSRLLVIDELGRLELCHDGGLSSALRMVDAGPSGAYPHILTVVREALIDRAHQRFRAVWHDDMVDIAPDEDSARLLLDALAPRA